MTVTRWVPNQHGAWVMIALPIVLGVEASRPSPWHVALVLAAYSGYLGSAAAQAWRRSRRRDLSRVPMLVYGAVFAASGLTLVLAYPALLAGLVVVVPAAVISVGGARPGTRRDLANSLAQVVQALVLVPAAGLMSGAFDPTRMALATAIAAGYLFGTVLLVRSVIRERGNAGAARLSLTWHLGLIALALVAIVAGRLSPAWLVLACLLAIRAALLPVLERRRAGTSHPLRPVQVGVVEIVASVAVVTFAFVWPA